MSVDGLVGFGVGLTVGRRVGFLVGSAEKRSEVECHLFLLSKLIMKHIQRLTYDWPWSSNRLQSDNCRSSSWFSRWFAAI